MIPPISGQSPTPANCPRHINHLRHFLQAHDENPELRRHPTPIRLTLLAAFCHMRGREITDALVDLLIATVHRIGDTAEKRVESELIADLKRVAGKPALLFKLAAASLANPDDTVRAVVFPVVDGQTLRDLVAEGEATGPMYRHHLQAVLRGSYRSYATRCRTGRHRERDIIPWPWSTMSSPLPRLGKPRCRGLA